MAQEVKRQFWSLSLQQRLSVSYLVQALVCNSFEKKHNSIKVPNQRAFRGMPCRRYCLSFISGKHTRYPFVSKHVLWREIERHFILRSTWKHSEHCFFSSSWTPLILFPLIVHTFFLFYFLCVVKPFVATREHPLFDTRASGSLRQQDVGLLKWEETSDKVQTMREPLRLKISHLSYFCCLNFQLRCSTGQSCVAIHIFPREKAKNSQFNY